MELCRFLVVGAGIAGAAAAAALAELGPTIVVERESQPGHHSTGRSAALFTETYGPPAVRALTAASRAFLEAPPPGFAEHPILSPRGELSIARAGQEQALERAGEAAAANGARVRRLGPREAEAMVPILRPGHVVGALHEPGAMDIDVHGLHGGFLRLLRRRGGRVLCGAGLLGLERRGGSWRAQTAAGIIEAAVLVDAAGAWADEVARMAGARPASLQPRRRTIVIPVVPEIEGSAGWPMVACAEETFYFKPEGAGLLVSPGDETPVAACDAQPDDIDVAHAIDRLERATTLRVERVARRWAGLRVFSPDRVPVIGWDDEVEGFLWLAGLGGYGIQTSPAVGRVVAALAGGTRFPDDIADRGVAPSRLAPRRA